jgi:WD40 repeat protein
MSTKQRYTTDLKGSGARARRSRERQKAPLSSSDASNPAAADSKHNMTMSKKQPEYIDSDMQPMLKQPILPSRPGDTSDEQEKDSQHKGRDSASGKTTTRRSDQQRAAAAGKFGEPDVDEQCFSKSSDSSEAPGAFAIKGMDHTGQSSNTLLHRDSIDPGALPYYNNHVVPHSSMMPAASLNSDYVTEAVLVHDQEEPELVFAEEMPELKKKNIEEEIPAMAFFANRKVQASLVLLCIIVVAMVILAAILATSNQNDSNNSNQELQRVLGPTAVPSAAPSFQPSIAPSTPAPTSLVWESLGEVISPPDGSFLFGFSLSLSADGNRVAVGAPNGKGTVSIYEVGRDDDGYSVWNQVGNTLNEFPQFSDAGTSVSISADGSTVAVGAPNANDPQGRRNTGMVEVYAFSVSDEVTWVRMGSPIYGEGEDDYLGGESSSISLSSDGTRVAVGALSNDADSFDIDAGSVRVYEFDSGDWVQLGQELNGERMGDLAGFSTDISGDGRCVAIGAPNSENFDLVSPDDAGQVYVYQLDPESRLWEPMGQALGGQRMLDRAGYSVSLSHSCTHVAVSSQVDSDAVPGNGTVDVFRFDDATALWEPVGQSLVGAVMEDRAGFDIALSLEGSRIAIGAPYHDRSQGYVIVYDFNGTDWEALGEPLRQDDVNLSGYSISMSRDGRRIAIGSPDDFSIDSLSLGSGEARVFELRDL